MELTGNKYGRSDWRKLLTTRRGTALVAAACAIVAAVILILAMQHFRHSVTAESNPETVLVAGGLIQKGTSGDAIASGQLFKPTTIVAKQVSAGAIVDTSQLHGKVAAADILPGQQLTAADFIASGGITSELAPDQRAMTITDDSARGMVGQLQAGDRVDVYGDLEPGGGRGESVVVLLMSNVPVLKAPTSSGGAGLGASNPQNQSSNVTLKVSDTQAGTLAYASDNGKVWLVLRPANASSSGSAGPVSAQSLISGSLQASSGGAR
jgi:Flp pilus assembly protein CpaB